jgi:hypothetical protein
MTATEVFDFGRWHSRGLDLNLGMVPGVGSWLSESSLFGSAHTRADDGRVIFHFSHCERSAVGQKCLD